MMLKSKLKLKQSFRVQRQPDKHCEVTMTPCFAKDHHVHALLVTTTDSRTWQERRLRNEFTMLRRRESS